MHSPGEQEQQQSTRAELSGLYGLAAIAKVISRQTRTGIFQVGCDSKEAIRKLQPWYHLTATTPDYDLAHSI